MFKSSVLSSICIILLIYAKDNKIGFYYDDDKNQHMIIEVPESFKYIRNAFLMNKTKSKDETDYVSSANIKYFTRTIRDVDEYKEYKEKKRTLPKECEEYKELCKRVFDNIYVDMNAVDKEPGFTYSFEFTLNDDKQFITRPFHFSKVYNKWELGVSPAEGKRNRMWIYIAGGVIALLIVSFVVFIAS